jgi:hypothetical protein
MKPSHAVVLLELAVSVFVVCSAEAQTTAASRAYYATPAWERS